MRRLEGKFENILEEAKNKKLRNDYVSITVTDEVEPYQFRERLEETYPFLLEVRVENTRTRTKMEEQEEVMDISDPLQVFGRFFEEMQGRQMSREEEALLKDVLEEMEGQP